jgi:ubiquinone/menaquinone biosynthesis C-methylase UbiE
MFADTAEFYDLIYSFKDYKKEAEAVTAIIKASCRGCKSVLDVGCGTSEHHLHMKDHFQMDGIDLNPSFVKISKQKNTSGNYVTADMATFRINRKYDVILCLFSSIGYLKTKEDIVKTLLAFKAHLNPGGVAIVEPWFTKDTWTAGNLQMLTYEDQTRKICRISRSYLDGEFSVLNFHYLIGTPERVQNFEEEHRLRLTTKEEMLAAFLSAGFEVSFEENGLTGRGLYLGKL